MSSIKAHLSWSMINSVFSLLVKILVLVAISYLVTPEVFGIYSIGIAFVLITTTALQLGIPTSLISYQEEDLTSTALLIAFIISIFSFLFFYFLKGIFENSYIKEYGIYFILLISLQIFLNILEASAKRKLIFKEIAISEIFSTFIGNGVIALFLAFKSYGLYALIYGQIFYCLLKLFMLWFKIDKKLININKKKINILLNSSISITLAELSNMAMIQIQRPIIGYNLGAAAAGIWSRVYQIIIIQLSALVQPMDYLILPLMSKIKNNKNYLDEVVVSILQVVSILTLIISAFTVCLAPIIIPLLLGNKWIEVILPLQIGSLILFFRGIERVLLSISRVLGTMRNRAIIQFIQLLIVIISLLIFSSYGLVYASYIYIFALLLGSIISLYTTKLTLGISTKIIFRSVFPGFIYFILMVISYYFLKQYFNIYFVSLMVFMVFILVSLCFWRWKKYFFTSMNIKLVENNLGKLSRNNDL